MSNLVSNEKDLPPFISTTGKESIPEGFSSKFNQGLKTLVLKDSSSALRYFKEANQAFPEHALCNFYLGQFAYHRGDFKNAKEYLSKAKDLDMLRFRASGELNEIIRQLCSEYQNTHQVDTKS